jgi:hypothetical protein
LFSRASRHRIEASWYSSDASRTHFGRCGHGGSDRGTGIGTESSHQVHLFPTCSRVKKKRDVISSLHCTFDFSCVDHRPRGTRRMLSFFFRRTERHVRIPSGKPTWCVQMCANSTAQSVCGTLQNTFQRVCIDLDMTWSFF